MMRFFRSSFSTSAPNKTYNPPLFDQKKVLDSWHMQPTKPGHLAEDANAEPMPNTLIGDSCDIV